jgi:hypothetical protein
MQKPKSSAQREGLGFLVDNLLSEYEYEKKNNNNDDYDKYHDRYDKIKWCIVELYQKISQRKCYNYKNSKNANNDTDTETGNYFSYINYSKIREQYRELLNTLYKEINEKTNESNESNEANKSYTNKQRTKWHVVILYRLLAFTRDISDGCGERDIAYMQLFEWARVDAVMANHALNKFVTPLHESESENKKTNPLGSWKDVKGLVAYMRCTMNMRDDRDMAAYLALTNFSISIVNERLAKDVLAFYKDDNENDKDNNDPNNKVSFAAKWIPRENKSKKYGNFYERLACDYYKMWLPKDRNANPISYEKAVVKCKIHYRKLVSFLNRYLETPQIKMCEQNWCDITFSRMTRQTRDAQDSALQNVKSDDYRCKRHNGNADRNECAEKYKVWKFDTINHRNGINTDLETHVRVAEYYSGCSSLAVSKNAEWSAFTSQQQVATNLQRVIPVLAGSSYKAIGLALATAENAITGRTLILEDDSEELALYDLNESFVKNVNGLRKRRKQQPQQQQQQGGETANANHNHILYECLTSVLKLLIESKVSAKQAKEVNPFTIMIFADDDSSPFFRDCDACFKETWNEASLLYSEFGYAVPNVSLWAMNSVVQHENNNNNNNNNNNRFHDHEVSYNSMSHGGVLQIRAGCNPTDICAYLGTKNNPRQRRKEFINANGANSANGWTVEWANEWNDLVEKLYNPRYFEFEQYFWKNKTIC